MSELGCASGDAVESDNAMAGSDVFVSARGIARGVLGGTIVWALILLVGFIRA